MYYVFLGELLHKRFRLREPTSEIYNQFTWNDQI